MRKSDRKVENYLLLLRAAFLILVCCAMTACEIDMSVAIDGKNPPTFRLSGSGNLVFFLVSEIPPDYLKLPPAQRDSSKNIKLWEIWPKDLSFQESKIWKLPPITYGKTPQGFTQEFPQSGDPPPLVEGKSYEAGGPASNANGGSVFFTIRNGEAVVLAKQY